MKFLYLLFAFSMLQMCNCQKSTVYQPKDHLFISGFDGGTGVKGYQIINTEKEYQKILNDYNTVFSSDPNEIPKHPKFPKDKKIIVYNLGNFRSGSHQPQKIEKIILNQDILEVYLPKNPSQGKGEMQIQVISSPWMIFSVPTHYQFKEIQIK